MKIQVLKYIGDFCRGIVKMKTLNECSWVENLTLVQPQDFDMFWIFCWIITSGKLPKSNVVLEKLDIG